MSSSEKLKLGYKNDEDKVRLDLIPFDVILDLGSLYTQGAKKYEPDNWKKGLRYGQVHAALLRHLWAWWSGEEYDAEGQHHLTSVIWNAVALRYYQMHEQKYTSFDDRPEAMIGFSDDLSEALKKMKQEVVQNATTRGLKS